MYPITEQDSSNLSINFFWWYLRSLFPEDSTTWEFLLEITVHCLKHASHAAFLDWSDSNDQLFDYRHSNWQCTLCIDDTYIKSSCKRCNFPDPVRQIRPEWISQTNFSTICFAYFYHPFQVMKEMPVREAIRIRRHIPKNQKPILSHLLTVFLTLAC